MSPTTELQTCARHTIATARLYQELSCTSGYVRSSMVRMYAGNSHDRRSGSSSSYIGTYCNYSLLVQQVQHAISMKRCLLPRAEQCTPRQPVVCTSSSSSAKSSANCATCRQDACLAGEAYNKPCGSRLKKQYCFTQTCLCYKA